MTAPGVIFPDPLILAPAILRDGLPLLWGSVVVVGTVDPTERPAAQQGLPYVRVTSDAQAGQYPVTQAAALRVLAYAGNPADSLRLAQYCKAILLTFPGSAEVRRFASTVGPSPTTDPDSGSPFAFFPVSAHLRPLPL